MAHLPPKYITVHAAATKPSMDHVDVEWIKRIHVGQNGWSDIGYHFVIKRDGTLQEGRPLQRVGAHVGGNNNTGNLGICLAGGVAEHNANIPEDNFTDKQYTELTKLLTRLHKEYPDAKLMGHNDFDGYRNRGCPCFNQHAYFEWLQRSWKAMHKPDDWHDHSRYDWHDSDPDAWNIPETFMDEVDTGKPLDY